MIVPYINFIIAPLLFMFLIVQWSRFYEEVSGNWHTIDVKLDASAKAAKNNIAIIVIIILAGGLPIIGILAAIAIPQFSAYRIKGYNSAAVSDCRNLKTTLEAYFADNQTYPQDIGMLIGQYNYKSSEGVDVEYSPSCKHYPNIDVIACENYFISTGHKQSDRIFATTSEKAAIYFKQKKEPNENYRPLQ
jgi:type II secretory pathway pseudopilin PulG